MPMARKMYYTEQEAADLLGVSLDGLAQYVKDQQLQVFKDGNKNMYKGDQVESMADGALGFCIFGNGNIVIVRANVPC